MKQGRGRKHVPTEERRKFVEEMVAGGIRQERICLVLGISDWTLRRYYRDEIDKAAVMADADVGKTLLNQARGGPECDWRQAIPSATIFWAKTRMGYRVPDPFADEYDDEGHRIIRVINSPEATRLSPPRPNGNGAGAGVDRHPLDRDSDGSDLH